MAKLETGAAKPKIVAARDAFNAALPDLKPVRDSIEHAEDRMRGLDRNRQPMTLAPISNRMINAPGGGVLVGDALNDRHYGGTVDDGTYAEVEVSDDTLEVARASVQAISTPCPGAQGPDNTCRLPDGAFAAGREPGERATLGCEVARATGPLDV